MKDQVQEPQGPERKHPPNRELTRDELTTILMYHWEWVNSGKKKGKKANLLDVNLQGETLQSAWEGVALPNMSPEEKAVGQPLILQGARLFGCDLREAVLCQANLQGADLTRANLREANLQDADLTDATGVLAEQLAGANVSGAKLPPDIHSFGGPLATVAEASRNARKLFISMLLGCLYSLLTIATTTDVRLLTNSASSPLPIIGTEIPTVSFYVAAPLLLLALYIYFHLYLQRLWEALADLPAVFPDGRPLDKRAYPWLLNGLVRSHFKLLRKNRPPLSRIQTSLSILLAWWAIPFTLLFFWGRYLTRHEWWGTGLHIALLVVSIGSSILFQRLARFTLRTEKPRSVKWADASRGLQILKRGAEVFAVGVVLYFFSLGAIEGVPPDLYAHHRAGVRDLLVGRWASVPTILRPKPPDLNSLDPRRLVPRILATIGYSPFADIQAEDVSVKPSKWKESYRREAGDAQGAEKERIERERILIEREKNLSVEGASLVRMNLNYASARRAFLVNADLRGINLVGTDLRGASLEGAQLSGAVLDGVILEGARLRWARLDGEVDLRNARLGGADLFGAFLHSADLRNADLRGANLERATLYGAKLQGVNFRGAKLAHRQLSSTEDWKLACYSDDMSEKLGISKEQNAKTCRQVLRRR